MERNHSVVAIMLSITVAIAMTMILCFATILGLNRILREDAFAGFNKSPLLWGGLTASAVLTFVATSALGNWLQMRRTAKSPSMSSTTSSQQGITINTDAGQLPR